MLRLRAVPENRRCERASERPQLQPEMRPLWSAGRPPRDSLAIVSRYPMRAKWVSADLWPDDVRLSDLDSQFVCQVCGTQGDLRPDFNWAKKDRSRINPQ